MDRDTKLNLITGAIIFAIVCLWAFFSSCTTERKAQAYYDRHPVKAATFCAKRFPPVEWTEVRTDTLIDTITTSYPVWVFDTLYVEGDTVVMKAKCPPSKTITRTIRDTIRTRVRDSAAYYAIQAQLGAKEKEAAVLSSQLKEAKEGRSKWRLWCLITWAVIALFVAYKVFTPKIPFIK